MQRLPNAQSRLISTLLIGVVAVPLSVIMAGTDSESFTGFLGREEVSTHALHDRARARRQQRLYWQAMEVYQDLRADGEDVERPDLNDMESIERLLGITTEEEVVEEEATHEAAEEESTPTEEEAALEEEEEAEEPSLTTQQLTTQDRLLLRRYTRARSCPESLRRYAMSGFYELCLSLVGEENVRDTLPVGLINDNVQLRTPVRRPTMRLRLQMLSEALDRNNRREDSSGPGRPTPYIQP